MECSADNASGSSTCCSHTHTQTHTHYIRARAFVSVCVSTIKALPAWIIQQVTDSSAGLGHVHVTCATALACSLFFFVLYLGPIFAHVWTFASAVLCAAWLHERAARPQTMRRALAEETHLSPTPTNRKPLSHPPHPRFWSHMHAERDTAKGSAITL